MNPGNTFPRIAPPGTTLEELMPSIGSRIVAHRTPELWDNIRKTRPGGSSAPLTVDERLHMIKLTDFEAVDMLTDVFLMCFALTGMN